MYYSTLKLLILFGVVEIIKSEEEWNGGRPPPFFPQGKERPIPRYAPTFSRYTPFLTEDTLPKPVYGRLPHSSSESLPSIYKPQGRQTPREFSRESSEEEEEAQGRREPSYPPFRRPPPFYGPGMFERMPPHPPPQSPSRREYPEPFRGPRGEVEEEKEAPPPSFLPPQYHGQRIPPPEYFSRKETENERPFFGPIPSKYSKQRPSEAGAAATTPFPSTASKPSNYSAPEHGSEVQLEKGKSRPDRLFAVKPPEFPPIPYPPPYPSPAPFTPPPSTSKFFGTGYSEMTTRPSPSIYSPLQGPFPEETTQSTKYGQQPSAEGQRQERQQQQFPQRQEQQQQGQQGPLQIQGQGKPKPNVLPQSFRSFFPPGFGPFADGKIQRFQ